MKFEKEFGKLSRDQVKHVYAQAYRFTTQQEEFQRMLEDDGLSSYLTSWAYLYDKPLLDLVAILILFFDWKESLHQITKEDDPQDAWFKFAESQEKEFDEAELTDEEKEELKEIMPFLLSVLLAIKGNMDAISQRHRSICEMMEEVRQGNDKALFEAITVDRSVVSCKTASDRIALAQGLGDEAFMDKMAKAFKRSVPRRVDPEHNDFRFMLELLYEAMASRPTVAQVEDILCEELELYQTHKDGLSKMIQKRNKIKRK